MSHLLPIVVLIIVIWSVLRKRQASKTMTKVGDREVWARASETRFPRYPRSLNPFSKKKGLK